MRFIHKYYCIFAIILYLISCKPGADFPVDPTPEPVTISLIEFQVIETNGAYDWEYFTIEGIHYLAVANWNNDSSFITNSYIYKWNGNTFSFHQSIETQGAVDWKYFTIDGDYFLAVAN